MTTTPTIADLPPLPVRDALPALAAALADHSCAVLEAPPGAGKTTLAPIALLGQPWATGRILMLEPRRVAARAAAERIAALLGEAPGARVGWRIRGESVGGPDTRIEVVTEGVLTRMLQTDPELTGISAVIFDEIHERSLNADLGLALTLEAQGALREDLRILAMSATLDAEGLAALMGNAPVVRSEGRMYPVETRWLEAPWRAPAGRRGPRFEDAMADLIAEVMAAEEGSALAFLPGAGEIARVEERLRGRLPGVALRPLHGAMPFAAQRAAIAAGAERKLVLATSIAETSLTIDGVRIVIDGGLARRARFDPAAGMSRLVTERVTKAEAEQRRGRAGRLEPGICARLWTKGEEGGLSPAPRPEILEADLAALALELAIWGAAAADLSFPDQPPEKALAEAQALLRDLGALDDAGRPTDHGAALARLPAHPRLGHMLLSAPAGARRDAAGLAALLEERDPLPRQAPVDLTLRMEALRDPKRFDAMHPYACDRGRIHAIRDNARRLEKAAARLGPAPSGGEESVGKLLARAYPDRIALMRRNGEAENGRTEARYLLSGGKGAALAGGDPLASRRLLAVAETDGDPRQAKIRLAAPLERAELEALYADRIEEVHLCRWNGRDRIVEARIQRKLFALALEDRRWTDAPDDARAAAMADGVRDLGLQALNWSPAAQRFRARAAWARKAGVEDLPDLSDEALLARLDDWLTPHLGRARKAADLAGIDLVPLLDAQIDWSVKQAMDAAAPSHFTAPTGSRVPVDYDRDPPAISIRLQELFGLKLHPSLGPRRIPLLVELLSPAGRPVQMTADLPGFWASSYADVRKDMRGRYPRHPWPEDPQEADPTRRAKPRGT